MAEIITNSFPFKLYEVVNAGSTDTGIFLGKASVAGINGSNRNFFEQLADENCNTTYVFASIVGGKNVRVDPATEDDPYIFIDTRWYDFRPCGAPSPDYTEWPDSSIVSSVEYSEDNDIITYFRNIATDGTIVIQIGDFIWSDAGKQGPLNNNPDNCSIELKAHKYRMERICENNSFYAYTEGVPGCTDVNFWFKGILPGPCFEIKETQSNIIVSYKPEDCEKCQPEEDDTETPEPEEANELDIPKLPSFVLSSTKCFESVIIRGCGINNQIN